MYSFSIENGAVYHVTSARVCGSGGERGFYTRINYTSCSYDINSISIALHRACMLVMIFFLIIFLRWDSGTNVRNMK